ncbi:MAG: gliotoxin biosynthesis [Lasallia pustulata]|uniref:gamma-glutamylcyclotransferase n=1 Tax=Lasallia pustulata TaxID=136370 RepID=A0A5M8PHN6_9LECA|nr:MAG: gliotoxin biosynthesis [Lasallia pustulata]
MRDQSSSTQVRHGPLSHRNTARRGSIAAEQAAVALQKVIELDATPKRRYAQKAWSKHLPCLSRGWKTNSVTGELAESPEAVAAGPKEFGGGPENPDTVLYLAYGSNLSAETFQGKRGIKPLAQLNVVVPELVMTFDLAGLPYAEPCFANTRYREQVPLTLATVTESELEKARLLDSGGPPKYHKDRWKKGLVGVVYEVTKEDYATIIATEGGGASYQDVIVDCYELPIGSDTVPEDPSSITSPFRAHTLFSPAIPPGAPGQPPPKSGGRIARPDPSYAQASARYLKLITDGADEHQLPAEYKKYLHELRPYTITATKQKLGQFIFLILWSSIIMTIIGMERTFADKRGKSPAWLVELLGAVFKAVWASYDMFFKGLFGDGERTIERDEDEGDGERSPTYIGLDEKQHRRQYT